MLEHRRQTPDRQWHRSTIMFVQGPSSQDQSHKDTSGINHTSQDAFQQDSSAVPLWKTTLQRRRRGEKVTAVRIRMLSPNKTRTQLYFLFSIQRIEYIIWSTHRPSLDFKLTLTFPPALKKRNVFIQTLFRPVRLVSLYRRVWEEIWNQMTSEDLVSSTGAEPPGPG